MITTHKHQYNDNMRHNIVKILPNEYECEQDLLREENKNNGDIVIVIPAIATAPVITNADANTDKDVVAIDVVEGNMFDIALQYSIDHKGVKIAMHNFANNYRPGLYKDLLDGRIYFATNTQEEQLLRASLVDGKHYLNEDNYPITDDLDYPCALISKNVIFDKDPFSGREEENKWIGDVISCALPYRPKIENNKYCSKKMKERVLRHMILCLSCSSDADIFITGLWGCGAFCHPLDEIIPLWFDAIKLSHKLPKRVMFVLYNDEFKNRAQQLFDIHRL